MALVRRVGDGPRISESELEPLPIEGESGVPIPPRQSRRLLGWAALAIGLITAFGAGWLANEHQASVHLALLNPCPVPRTVRFFDSLKSSNPVFVLRVPRESRTELSTKYSISPSWSFDVAVSDNSRVQVLVREGDLALGVLAVPLCEPEGSFRPATSGFREGLFPP